jgi:hypothetical protein
MPALLGTAASIIGPIVLQMILDKALGGWANKQTHAAYANAAQQNAAGLTAAQLSALQAAGLSPRYDSSGQLIGGSALSKSNPSVMTKRITPLAQVPGMPMTAPNAVSAVIPRRVKLAGKVSGLAHSVGMAGAMALPYIMQGIGNTISAGGKTAGAVAEAGGRTAGALGEALGSIPGALSNTSERQRRLYGGSALDLAGGVTGNLGKALNVGLSSVGQAANVGASSVGQAVGSTVSNVGNTLQLYNMIQRLADDPTLIGGRANMVAHLLGYQGLLNRSQS